MLDHAFPRPARALQIAVVTEGGGWRILIDQQRVAAFARRRDALLCAVELARGHGAAVELLIHDRFGELTSAPGRAA